MLADQFNPGEHDAHAKGLSVFLTKGQFGGDQLLHHQSCFSAEPHSGIVSGHSLTSSPPYINLKILTFCQVIQDVVSPIAERREL